MSKGTLRVASFTVHANPHQVAAWRMAAEAAGFSSVGSWLAEAADSYLRHVQGSGRPRKLRWRQARFKVRLLDGEHVLVPGRVSHPFAIFRGSVEKEGVAGCHAQTLVYLPGDRILATLRTSAECQALASELAATWVTWGDGVSEERDRAVVIVERYRR